MVQERILISIDVNNLWHSCQEVFGNWYRVDLPAIVEKVKAQRFEKCDTRFVAYTVTLPPKVIKLEDGSKKRLTHDNQRFLEYLRRHGFEVKNRDAKYKKGEEKPYHTDWDVGISLDAVNDVDNFDTFILISGDGDYSLLLEDLKKRGKRVEVMTFEKTGAKLLHLAADKVIFLTEKEVFLPRKGSHVRRS